MIEVQRAHKVVVYCIEKHKSVFRLNKAITKDVCD